MEESHRSPKTIATLAALDRFIRTKGAMRIERAEEVPAPFTGVVHRLPRIGLPAYRAMRLKAREKRVAKAMKS